MLEVAIGIGYELTKAPNQWGEKGRTTVKDEDPQRDKKVRGVRELSDRPLFWLSLRVNDETASFR